MSRNLFDSIRETLRLRWDKKFGHIAALSQTFADRSHPVDPIVSRALRDAFSAGYRTGYWDGVVDVVECSTSSMEHRQTPVVNVEVH